VVPSGRESSKNYVIQSSTLQRAALLQKKLLPWELKDPMFNSGATSTSIPKIVLKKEELDRVAPRKRKMGSSRD